MPNPAAAPRKPMLTTRECEELNVFSKLNDWQADYRQLGPGVFESSFDLYRSDSLCVTDQHCNREMAASGVPPENQIPLFLILNRGHRGIFNGKELQDDEVFVMRPGSEGTFRTPPQLRLINLQIPEARLRAALLTMADRALDQIIPDTRRMILPKDVIHRLAEIADRVLDTVRNPSGASAPGIWQHEAEEYLLTTLVSGLTKPFGADRELGRKRRGACVASAKDYIEAHLDSPLGLETLAREVGVSLRTLESAFRETFNITPLRYVKIRRLHAAHHHLHEANDRRATVTDIALRFGFSHLSYFAHDYNTLFGEYPSQTLRD